MAWSVWEGFCGRSEVPEAGMQEVTFRGVLKVFVVVVVVVLCFFQLGQFPLALLFRLSERQDTWP